MQEIFSAGDFAPPLLEDGFVSAAKRLFPNDLAATGRGPAVGGRIFAPFGSRSMPRASHISGRSQIWCLALLGVLALCGACRRDPTAARQRFLDSGNRYMASGEYAEATVQFRNARAVDPRLERRARQARRSILAGWELRRCAGRVCPRSGYAPGRSGPAATHGQPAPPRRSIRRRKSPRRKGTGKKRRRCQCADPRRERARRLEGFRRGGEPDRGSDQDRPRPKRHVFEPRRPGVESREARRRRAGIQESGRTPTDVRPGACGARHLLLVDRPAGGRRTRVDTGARISNREALC